jgi:gamma-glutamyltranspeptidase / glutathione hydrolase
VGPDFIHWQVEAAKLASRTVIPFTAIPFVTVPVEILLSDAYNAKRQVLISERSSLHQRPGAIPGHGKMLDEGGERSDGGRL